MVFKKKNKKVDDAGIFGIIDNVAEKYGIGKDGEVHTKIVNVPSPIDGRIRIDDELEPSRYLLLEFKGIYDSHYIGVNNISFYDKDGCEVPFRNIEVDGKEVDDINVKPAMPVNGWWAVVGEYHSLLFDFMKDDVHVAFVHMTCTNSASTPKYLHITDAREPVNYDDEGYSGDLYLQLAGDSKSPENIQFRRSTSSKNDLLDIDQIVNDLNSKPPKNGFETYLSEDAKDLFVFYRKGLRSRVCNYFFGTNPSEAVNLVNSVTKQTGTTIDDVAYRAMTIKELRAVRAIILSDCVKNKWKSSKDQKTPLTPSTVNLYDLNSILIKPLTKKRNCAFKELFGSGNTPPAYYVSHWWGESILDFIRCCEYHAMMNNLEDDEASYWVCAHANRQHDLGTDLGADPEESSFNRAMSIAQGVLLIIDQNVTATSRIWVAYELFRTTTKKEALDISIYSNGEVNLIASKDLPDETPYQKTKREMKFPFKDISKFLLWIILHKGEASQMMDKVRILNTMCNMKDDLDNDEILDRIAKKEKKVMKYLEECDWSLRSHFAQKAIALSMSTEGQSIHDFYGFDLIDIIRKDTTCTHISFDNLVALDRVSDDDLKTLISLISPQVESYVLNVRGCRNLTDAGVSKLHLPGTLKSLVLKIGHARNISNMGIVDVCNSIPQNLEKLELDLTGFKNPDGTYLPVRYNDHLQALGEKMPTALQSFSLTTTLASDEESLQGFVNLAQGFSDGLKELRLFVRWACFSPDCFTVFVENLPSSIEILSLTAHDGEYIDDENLRLLHDACKKFYNLKEFKLSTRDSGARGFYCVRDFNKYEDLSNACE